MPSFSFAIFLCRFLEYRCRHQLLTLANGSVWDDASAFVKMQNKEHEQPTHHGHRARRKSIFEYVGLIKCPTYFHCRLAFRFRLRYFAFNCLADRCRHRLLRLAYVRIGVQVIQVSMGINAVGYLGTRTYTGSWFITMQMPLNVYSIFVSWCLNILLNPSLWEMVGLFSGFIG